MLSFIASGMPQRSEESFSSIRFCAKFIAVSSTSKISRYAFSSGFFACAVAAHASQSSRAVHSRARSARAASTIVISFSLVMRNYLLHRERVACARGKLFGEFLGIRARRVRFAILSHNIAQRRLPSVSFRKLKLLKLPNVRKNRVKFAREFLEFRILNSYASERCKLLHFFCRRHYVHCITPPAS